MSISLQDVRAAAERIGDVIAPTGCRHSRTLSDILGAEIYIKFESELFTASFKERGALNKLLSLSEAERAGGVIAMSAGNHAKAVAYHATRLGIASTIVMSRFTPNVKVADTEQLGARVVMHGDNLDAAASHARELAQQEGYTFVHPFDDEAVMAGQGTLALEILEAQPDLDALLVPIGGGGLISGVATVVKALKPDIELIGVQASSYSGVHAALKGEASVSSGITIAEGIAVKSPGEKTLAVIRESVDDVVLVSEEDIEQAIYLYLSIEKTVAEGAGAAALAAVMAYPDRFRGRKVGVILSGANVDSRILASVLMRHLARTGRLVSLKVKSRDTPGALAEITTLVGECGGNIIDVSHQRTFTEVGIREVEIALTLESRDRAHTEEIQAVLVDAGYSVIF
jgi:threonine dehydratase